MMRIHLGASLLCVLDQLPREIVRMGGGEHPLANVIFQCLYSLLAVIGIDGRILMGESKIATNRDTVYDSLPRKSENML